MICFCVSLCMLFPKVDTVTVMVVTVTAMATVTAVVLTSRFFKAFSCTLLPTRLEVSVSSFPLFSSNNLVSLRLKMVSGDSCTFAMVLLWGYSAVAFFLAFLCSVSAHTYLNCSMDLCLHVSLYVVLDCLCTGWMLADPICSMCIALLIGVRYVQRTVSLSSQLRSVWGHNQSKEKILQCLTVSYEEWDTKRKTHEKLW